MFKSPMYIICEGQENSLYSFNTLNGLFDSFTGNIADFLRGKTDKLSDDEYSQLLEKEYIFKSQVEYDQTVNRLIKFLESVDKKKKPNFILIPSYKCNLRCTYCYENNVINTGESMTPTIVEKMLETTIALSQNNLAGVPITLMGGEPLLRENEWIIRRVLGFIKNYSCKYNIITNGVTLLYYLPIFREFDLQPQSIQVTLDGPQEIHDKRRPFANGKGSFEIISKGIKQVLQEGINVFIRINIDSGNLNQLSQLADFFVAEGWVDFPNFYPYIYTMSDGGCLGQEYCLDELDVAKKIVEFTERNPIMEHINWDFHGIAFLLNHLKSKKQAPSLSFCGATSKQYVLEQNGGIYTCWWAVEDPDLKVGEFIPDFKMNQAELKKWQNRSVQTIDGCLECKYLFICGGGCAYKAQIYSGDFTKPRCSPFGDIYRACIPFIYKKVQERNSTE